MTAQHFINENLRQSQKANAPFLWFGGKGKTWRYILPHFPTAKIYVEPFAGAASIFFNLPENKYPVVVLNDLHDGIITLFRVLQDKAKLEELQHRLCFTPYSRAEFCKAIDLIKSGVYIDDIQKAWAFFVTQNQGFGGVAETYGRWGRVFASRTAMAETNSSWQNRISKLMWYHKKLMTVQLDNQDALQVIQYWDSPDTLFYCDPPYLADTRKSGKYQHDCCDDFHNKLVDTLSAIKGQCVLSGYDNPIYDRLNWQKKDFKTTCSAAGRTRGSGLQDKGNAIDKQQRVETLWLKINEVTAGGLFG